MRKIIEYKALGAKSLEDLTDLVNDYIKLGFDPVDRMLLPTKNVDYIQVMIKYEYIQDQSETKHRLFSKSEDEYTPKTCKFLPVGYYTISQLESILEEIRKVENES